MLYRIDNILDNKFRKSVLERSKKYLKSQEEFPAGTFKGDSVLPGKQTPPDLHMKLDYGPPLLIAIRKATGINFTIGKSWVNWTNGDKKDVCWHTHPDADYSAVWYLKTPLPFFNNGTLISEDNSKTRDRKRDRKDKFYKASQNSLLLFPGRMNHTAPLSPFRFHRYTLALNLMKR